MTITYTSASDPKLTLNVKVGDRVVNDGFLGPPIGLVTAVTNDSTLVLDTAATSTGTADNVYIIKKMENDFGTHIEEVPSRQRLIVSNGNEIPWEYGMERDHFYPLGNPAPDTKLTATPGGGSAIPSGTYKYVFTVKSEFGESNISPVETIVHTGPADIDLTVIGRGSQKVLSRKVYRTIDDGNDFFLLTTIGNNHGTTFTDTTLDADLILGTPLDIEDRSQPPELRRVHWHHNRAWGFVEGSNKVHFSHLDTADEWNLINGFVRTSNGDQVRNILPLGDVMVIYTNRSIEIVTGRSEETFQVRAVEPLIGLYGRFTPTRIEKNQHIFLSRDGLRLFNGQSSQRISGEDVDLLFATEAPESGQDDFRMERSRIHKAFGFYWQNKFFLLYPSTGQTEANRILVFDFETQAMYVIANLLDTNDPNASEANITAIRRTYSGVTNWNVFKDEDSLMVSTDAGIYKFFTGNTIVIPGAGGDTVPEPADQTEFDVAMRWYSKNMDLHEHGIQALGDKLFKYVHLIVQAGSAADQNKRLTTEIWIDREKLDIEHIHNFSNTGKTERVTIALPNDTKGQEIQLRFIWNGRVFFQCEGFDIDYENIELGKDGGGV